MRSSESSDQYQRMVAGMIKDIAFHELFVPAASTQMEQFRDDNARNPLFDHNMAFDLLDSLRSGQISGYDLQGFLQYVEMDTASRATSSSRTSVSMLSALWISQLST